MGYDPDFLTRLLGAPRLLEEGTDLEQGLSELAEMTARLLATQRCSIMLLTASDDGEQPLLRVFAHYGDLPKAAYQEVTRQNQGIAGHVIASGQPLLIADIARSPFARSARRAQDDRHRSLISAPIRLGEKTIGVINVDSPVDGRTFGQDDLRLMELFALFVGKSIHVVQLQNVLRSRFLRYAVANEQQEPRPEPPTVRPVSPDPDRLTRIVAKSMYRELIAGGFSPAQVINVASALMDELRDTLARAADQDPRMS
jgi:L-methionine (R)-S-oxide reductase